MLFDYFLDLWTSLEVLVDFFRISADRRDVSLENHENATRLLGKSGPACRRDARKHKVICSRWRSKRAPQGNPKSIKILYFRSKLVQSWCGVRLASSWLHFGSVLASAWLENHENVVFFTTGFDYFQAFLIRGLHKHIVFYSLFDHFWAPAVV